MNGNCSTTGCKSPERLPDVDRLTYQWKSIDWKKAESEVIRNLNFKISYDLQSAHCGPWPWHPPPDSYL